MITDLRQLHGLGGKVATEFSGFDVDRATDRGLGLGGNAEPS